MLTRTDHLNPTASPSAHDTPLFISLELSRSSWLVTALLPGSAKLSKHTVKAGSHSDILGLLSRLKAKADAVAEPVKIIAIHEAGLDGFWVHRLLENNGVESHIVDPASIALPRRKRRAKTDAIDGETLLRTLLAWRRGEPRVCSMVVPPTPEDEDRRRLVREHDTLLTERVQHTNRIRGLLAGQGIRDYNPLRQGARERLETLETGDGRPLPSHLKAEIRRELERLALIESQFIALEAERKVLMQPDQAAAKPDQPLPPAAAMARLSQLKGIGPGIASVVVLEALFRHFDNRRQIAAYAGLVPTPWKSGTIDHEQGISKSGNPRLRVSLIELAWLWLRWQPASALSQWFRRRVAAESGVCNPRLRRITIVALARKLLVALWRYVEHGVVPEGAVLKNGASAAA
jgi:transposase